MIGFPKNPTDLLNFIKRRKEKGHLSSGRDLNLLLEEQTNHYVSDGVSFKKQEGLRYFPIQKLIQANPLFPEDFLDNEEVIESQPLLPKSFRISVRNGSPSFSKPPKGVSVFLWKDFLKNSSFLGSKMRDKIHQSLQKKRNSFCSLNNVLSLNGFILVIDKTLNNPIEIQYFQNFSEKNNGLSLRTFVFLQEGCSAQILENFYGNESKKDSASFFNLQTDCILEKNSNLNYIRLDQGKTENIQVNQIFSFLGKGAKGTFLTLNLNSGLSQYLTHIFQKEKSSSDVRGLSLLGDDKHTDHTVVIEHEEESYSRQFYQSILFHSVKHIFNGIIRIGQKAQKTSASQLNKNLLFGKRAFAISCPELDIKADDVMAVHGATFSSLDEKKEILFYLQSRGLSLEQSSHLLLSSIIREAVSFMDEKTFSSFKPLIWDHLKILQKSQS